MHAAPNGSPLDSNVRMAISQLQQGDCRYDHIILVADGSTSRSAPLQLIETAAGGLDVLRSKLNTHETRFALLRVQARLLLVISLGQDLTGPKRALVLVQGRALQSSLGTNVFAAVTIATASELTSALVGSKLQLDGFAHVSSPDINQDFLATWSSTCAPSIATRAKPSAPSSPEEVGHDAHWSRPTSDLGPCYPYYRANEHSLTTSASSWAKSFHSSLFAKLSDRDHTGIVIDLEPVVEARDQAGYLEIVDTAPAPPPKAKLLSLPIRANECSKAEASSRPSTATTTPLFLEQLLQKPIPIRKPNDLGIPHGAREWRSADEQQRLSDEQERKRVDEAIRDEVMKKLRAEQQGLLKSPAARTPRLAVSPPLAPPPPFAPPPAPSPPSAASTLSERSSSSSSPRLSCKHRHEDDTRFSREVFTDTISITRNGSRSPQLEELIITSEDDRALNASFRDAPGMSESRESIRSSVQSQNIWEFAEAASQRASFLSLLSKARSSNIVTASLTGDRLASCATTPIEPRSRQPSYSESVTSAGLDNHRYATSSSTTSVAASSIFDKELPAPPVETQSGCSDGEEWKSALGTPDSTTHPLAPRTECSSESARANQTSAKEAEGAEMQDLRDLLAQAEARAKAAEEAAQVAVREAQSETRRLATELAKVERGTKDKMEAEAVRRAKWAREQVARDQLDAYERSFLEADEKRRRRAIEEQRWIECERANRIREEQEWREQEAERIKEEYELKIKYLAEREAKLKAEAEAKEQRERERIEQEEARTQHRRNRLAELQEALLKGAVVDQVARATPLVSGWLNLQVEGGIQWKRRWYQVIQRQLVLSRSSTDSGLMTTISLDPSCLHLVSDERIDCTMSHSLCLEVRQTPDGEPEQDQRRYLISTETQAAKEEIELVIEAIASL